MRIRIFLFTLLLLLLVGSYVAGSGVKVRASAPEGLPAAVPVATPVASSFSTAVPANRQSAIGLLGSDEDATPLTYAIGAGPSHGTLSNLNVSTGVVIYTPVTSYVGPDSFTYTVTSGAQTSPAGTVTLTVTNAKTRIVDSIVDGSGAPRQGKVTFILTQPVTTPAGISPAGASVSATLNGSGQFDISVYPSKSLSPNVYYQVWFADSTTLNRELLGVYEVPLSTTTIVLAPYKVTDTNLAARYTFASEAAVSALQAAVASATLQQLLSGAADTNLQKYDAATAKLANSNVTSSGSNTTVSGTLTAGNFVGNGSSLTGIATGTGGVINTGSTTVGADSDSDGSGVLSLQVKGVEKLGVRNDGAVVVGGLPTVLNVASFGAVCNGSTSDTTAIGNAATAAATAGGAIYLPPSTGGCKIGTATINVPVVSDGGSFLLTTGQTTTFTGPIVATPTILFRNALAGQGTVSFAGNKSLSAIPVQWWGGKGDDSTDNTAAVQAIIDMFSAAGMDGTILYPAGIYRISGALQDTSFSNSQIVLPKRSISQSMITIRFLGATPVSQAWPTTASSILKGTLTSGTGFMIGVRANWGSGTSTYIEEAQNAHTRIVFHAENMIFRQVSNPTNSGLDLRFVHRSVLINSRIDVEGITAGPAAIIPDIFCVEPTTATSYGLMTMLDGVGSATILRNVSIVGYYNGMRWGELVDADNVVFAGLKVGIEVRGATHASRAGTLLFVTTAKDIKALGRDPYFTTASPHTNILNIYQLGIENSTGLMAWAATTAHIEDASNYLYGRANWYQGLIGAQTLIKTGAGNFHTQEIDRSYNSRGPFTELTGGTQQFQDAASDHAIDETYRGLPSSGSSRIAWKALTTDQAGTNNLVGILAFANANIAGNVDKRLGQIAVFTNGATNSGRMSAYIMNGGTLGSTPAWTIDKLGNFYTTKLKGVETGSNLTISSNAITVTSEIHHVTGTGLLKTINFSADFSSTASIIVTLIPTHASGFTYDATGNIVVPAGGGTAIAGKPITFIRSSTNNVWYPSY